VLGQELEAFEKEFAAYCQAHYAIGVNSGTSALHLSLLAAGVGQGDEVITVPFTFVATVAAICYTGARPVFVDITPCSFTNELLADAGVQIPEEMLYARHVYHIYAVQVPQRDALQDALYAQGIQTGIHYPLPVHLLKAHADPGYRAGDFPQSERVASTVLSLLCFRSWPCLSWSGLQAY
jgi:dTDP-4-amino-4,6-dideoxygalactose transaminase